MKFKFSFLITITAIMLASVAAFFSVFGLSQLFAGASLAVIFMASILELSKVVAVSLLQRYWSQLSKILKTYLLLGVFVLICITSGGIYGFLSNAFQKNRDVIEKIGTNTDLLITNKTKFQFLISENQKIIDSRRNRQEQLYGLRNSQETRLQTDKKTRQDISSTNKEIQTISTDVEKILLVNRLLLDSVTKYDIEIAKSKNSSVELGEIGPLKYIAKLTGKPIEKIINWFILLLVFVFDPLAVALVVAANKIIEIEKKTPFKKVPKIELPIPSNDSEYNEVANESIVEPIIDNNQTAETQQPINHQTNRGFSVNIPQSRSKIERI